MRCAVALPPPNPQKLKQTKDEAEAIVAAAQEKAAQLQRDKLLFDAVKRDDVPTLLSMLHAGIPLDSTNHLGLTLLDVAYKVRPAV